MRAESSMIKDIRVASRLMVRELGFMNQTLAQTDYSPSVVHTLLEVETQGAMTAAQLVQILGLEKSSVSRLLAKLVDAGELQVSAGSEDARTRLLSLTDKGRRSVSAINHYADQRVIAALEKLDAFNQQRVCQGLDYYARALQACRDNSDVNGQSGVDIITGYQPGMIGRITEMHGEYYAREHNFGPYFEGKVAAGLADFTGRLDNGCNQIWLARVGDRIVGSVAIDGEDLGNNEAHLRWFILDDGCRGSGIGKRLIAEAMNFCDRQGFAAVQLWTFDQLTAARRLYESFGFELSEEWQGEQWGSRITEQRFTRRVN